MESTRDEGRKQKVLMGTCGWSDHTLLKCGRFYPASVRSAEDRLRHYGTHFPCVEVDTSTYAIPSRSSVQRWLQAVPPGFIFHFKAFGLFCSKSCPITAIPGDIRCKVSAVRVDDHVRLSNLSTGIQEAIWTAFNSVLEPVFAAGSLGVVLFQFHLSFKPSEENRAHVLWCRRHLNSRFEMAVEFRNRDWFVGERYQVTCEWLKENKMAFVAADELAHETFQKDREQTGPLKGQKQWILPVAWAVTQPKFHYIRVHRREGCTRLLSESELQTWVTRLQTKLPDTLQGPIYFLWGTDWEDQPILNARSLTQLLPSHMIFNWKASQFVTPARGSLLSMFKSAQPTVQTTVGSYSKTIPVLDQNMLAGTVVDRSNNKSLEKLACGNKESVEEMGSYSKTMPVLDQNMLAGTVVKRSDNKSLEKLACGNKQSVEEAAETHKPIKKATASPPLLKKAKPSPLKDRKQTGSCTSITSFFKPAASET